VSARLPPPLVGLTTGAERPDLSELERRIHAALRGGLPGVLLREPALDDRPLAELAARLRARAPQLWIGLHDRPHLVQATGADGVHLGFRSLAPAGVRGWLPGHVAVGLSTHAADDAARWRGADYLFHGPVFATAKVRALEPIGPAGLAAAVARAPVPVLGLGGITPERVAAVRAAGAAGVAVLSGLIGSADPARAAAAYLAALEGRGGPPGPGPAGVPREPSGG